MRPALPTLALVLFATTSLAPRPVRADDASQVHKMKRVELIDRHGFEKPIAAFSLLIPSDWEFESDVIYPKGAPCGDMFKLQFRAHSKDGRTAIELHPAYLWRWADDPQSRQMMANQNQQGARYGNAGCDVMQPMRAADFLTRIAIPKLHPGATLAGTEPLKEGHDKLQQQVQAQQMQANRIGLHVRYSADDARARISYDLNGAPEEEWLNAVINVQATAVPVFNRGRTMQSANYQASARMLFSLRAPKGQLEANEKLYGLVLSTIRIEPEWQQRIGQIQQNIAKIQRKGEADRAAIRAKSQADIAAIRKGTVENQQRAQEQSFNAFDQNLRDVETYRDPNSGAKVELSNQYGHAWTNGNGEYILSESPGYNPNASQNGNWTQMEQVPAGQ